jgi:phosphatidylglycerophosphate synthase
MGYEFALPLVLVGLTILIFAACWRFSGFRMLYDESACALYLGPGRTALWMTASVAGILYLPFALLGLLFGDLSGLTGWELLARFGGSFLVCLAFGLVAALARVWRIFSPRSYRQGLRRALRPARQPGTEPSPQRHRGPEAESGAQSADRDPGNHETH